MAATSLGMSDLCSAYERNALILMAKKFKNNIQYKDSSDSTLRDIYSERCEFIKTNIEEKLSNYNFNVAGNHSKFLRYWLLLFNIICDITGEEVMGDIISKKVDNIVLINLKKGLHFNSKYSCYEEAIAVKEFIRVRRLEEKNVMLKCVRFFEKTEILIDRPEQRHINSVPFPDISTRSAIILPQLQQNKKKSRYGVVDYTETAVAKLPPAEPQRSLPSLVQVVAYPKQRFSYNLKKRY